MKLASADLIVWAIIAIVVAVAKGIGKLSATSDNPLESDDTDAPVRPPVARPRPVARPPTPRPVMRTAPQAVPAQIREMMERLAQPARPVAPPPQPVAPPKPPEPAPAKAAPAPVAEEKPAPSRSSQWALALRDKSNVRNIIISAEIIGPPKGGG